MLVTRFAPSPTGALHLGHAFSALSAFDLARRAGGRFLLRIEDIDAARSRPAFEAAILDDLAWIGVRWDGSVRRQSEHTDEHRAALARLQAAGLVYRCFRTRREVADAIASAPHGPGGDAQAFHAGPLPPAEEAERLAAGQPYAWRLSLHAAAERLGGFARLQLDERGRGPDGRTGLMAVDPASLGDVVLARKDLGVAYHLAVVVDDAAQGVTDVVRGEDLQGAAHLQRVLQALLDLPAPRYHHHRLLAGPDGRRLSKRDGAVSLHALREAGVTPAQVRARLGLPDG